MLTTLAYAALALIALIVADLAAGYGLACWLDRIDDPTDLDEEQ